MSHYAQNIPTHDAWVLANAPDTLKDDAITYWKDWYGDTPAYRPWAEAVDAKLAELLGRAQSAPVWAVGVFQTPEKVDAFLASGEFARLVAAYLDKEWHLRAYVVPGQRNVCAFYVNTPQMAQLCPLLRAK